MTSSSLEGKSRVYLTAEQVSTRWEKRISVGTLANWRAAGKGPRYTKIGGRILYPLEYIVAYENESDRA